MSAVAAAIVGGAALAGSVYSANQQKKAARGAARIQKDAADAGIEEEKRQFDAVQKLLAPYINRGNDATELQAAFLGLSGLDKQREAIEGIKSSEQYTAGVKEGENAILQNASATGGLRGGNVQASLAKFRPNLLNQIIAQRFAGLDSLAGRGQASAAGQAAAAQNSANAVAGLLQDQGAAQAGAALARGQAGASVASTLVGAAGTIAGQYLNRPSVVAQPAIAQPTIAPPNYTPTTSGPQY